MAFLVFIYFLCHSERSEESSAVCTSTALHWRFLFFDIAALSVTFFLAVKKKVTKEKLPAAPASMSGSANCAGVVAEPDDAGFGG